MSNKPDIKLTQNSSWVCDEDYWYVRENPDDNTFDISSDGETLCVSHFIESMASNVNFIVEAHDVLAVLDKDGALDEYLKNRHSK